MAFGRAWTVVFVCSIIVVEVVLADDVDEEDVILTVVIVCCGVEVGDGAGGA